MKHLSLKARLTLLYTSMMILLFAFIIGLLFSVGSQAILTNTRALLEEQVSSSFDSVSYRNNRLEFDSDLLQVEQELLVHDSGRVAVQDKRAPFLERGGDVYDFSALSCPFSFGRVRLRP